MKMSFCCYFIFNTHKKTQEIFNFFIFEINFKFKENN